MKWLGRILVDSWLIPSCENRVPCVQAFTEQHFENSLIPLLDLRMANPRNPGRCWFISRYGLKTDFAMTHSMQ